MKVEDVRKAPLLSEIQSEVQKIIDSYPLGLTAFNRSFDVNYMTGFGFKFGKLQPCPMLTLAPIMNLPHKNGRGKGKWPNVEEVYHHYLDLTDYKEAHRAGLDSFDEACIIAGMIERGDYKIEY